MGKMHESHWSWKLSPCPDGSLTATLEKVAPVANRGRCGACLEPAELLETDLCSGIEGDNYNVSNYVLCDPPLVPTVSGCKLHQLYIFGK